VGWGGRQAARSHCFAGHLQVCTNSRHALMMLAASTHCLPPPPPVYLPEPLVLASTLHYHYQHTTIASSICPLQCARYCTLFIHPCSPPTDAAGGAESGRPAGCLPCLLQSPCSAPPPTHHRHHSRQAPAGAASGPATIHKYSITSIHFTCIISI
jgi:hypothetical protein